MLATTHDLLELTAAELMSRDVIVIPERMSLRGAASLLRRARVSGAPVVNAEGRCTGVLSATDFLRRVEGAIPWPVVPCPCGQSLHSEWEIIDVETVPSDEVRASMTRDAVTVRTDADIGELARMMLDAHIHRVIVTDAGDRPIGIISSTDILAALVRASQEANSASSAS